MESGECIEWGQPIDKIVSFENPQGKRTTLRTIDFAMTEYFQRDNINSDYSEFFLIKVDSNFVTLYGTVQTWE